MIFDLWTIILSISSNSLQFSIQTYAKCQQTVSKQSIRFLNLYMCYFTREEEKESVTS